MIERVPLPVSGVALGLASLGNLLFGWSEFAYWVCGSVSAMIVFLLLLKLALHPDSVREDLMNPILASVSATFPMALMMLSTYLSKFVHYPALAIWLFAILLHVALIVHFTGSFILDLDITKVFASYFVVYVGIVVASVTCPVYGLILLGQTVFWFGFINLIPLMILISYRYLKYRDVPEPMFPLLCIYSAPVSLCIVGYLKSMTQVSEPFVIVMYAVSTTLYILGLIVAIKTLTGRFYHSYAALTFPMVISATASQMMSSVMNSHALETMAVIQTVIALVIVTYVLIRYAIFIIGPVKG
jgi:exfoliative toxin A/B